MRTLPLSWVTALACYTAPFTRAESPDVDTTFISSGGALGRTSAAQLPLASSASGTVVISGSTTTFSPIFTVPPEAAVGAPVLPNINDPKAIDPQTVCPGYMGSNVVRTQYGLTAILRLAGNACDVYGTDIDTLNLTVEYQSNDRLSVKIIPAAIGPSNTSQYILPNNLIHKPTVDDQATIESLTNDLGFVWSNDPTFSFTIIRKSSGDVLFSTEGTKLVFENQFIEFASPLPENYNLYGLGEVIHGLRLGNNLTRTLWNADVGDPVDYNLYGSHPFYLETRYFEVDKTTGNLTLVTGNSSTENEYVSYSHGVYLRNAHGQEILLRPQNITWRTIGGSIDLYFFAGPTQQEVTAAYQRGAIGLPAMQQYFTFGYHQCRWGYANWSQVEEVVMNYEKFGIPLETIWTDIDYMNQYRDFDNDPIRYNYTTGQDFLARLHASGRHYVPIVDSAIYVPNPNNASDAYPTFNRGNASQSFMTNPDGSLYIGDVWPGYTVFPDWISPGAGNWWTNEMVTWHGEIPFDGIWIDMSEASSFCIGSCGAGNITMNPVHPPFKLPGESGNIIFDYPESFNVSNMTEAASAASASSSQAAASSSAAGGSGSSTTPNYVRTSPTPGVRNINYPPYVVSNVQGELGSHAVSPNATHADGTQEYDVHNLFGHQILNATYYALLSVFPGKRPFIIGRSTFAGSGMFAGHWGGDNYSKWAYMFFSIPQALEFSLFGIPMFGVAFYRNHNVLSAIPQEAYVWASVIDASKTAMNIRFQLLPYMYTLFYLAHTTGSTVMRALAWEFPNDPSLAAADRQFLLGPAIMVTPVLNPGATTVDGVFPGVGQGGTVWYDWYTQAAVNATAGKNTTIDAPLGYIPVFIRGGNIIPTQEPAMTTRDARKNPWGVIAALDLEGAASGSLYIDDGESLMPNATLYVDFIASNSSLYASARGTYVDNNSLANITILGVQTAVSNVSFNGMPVAGSGVKYDANSKVLTVTGLRNMTAMGAWAADWEFSWM